MKIKVIGGKGMETEANEFISRKDIIIMNIEFSDGKIMIIYKEGSNEKSCARSCGSAC